MDIFQALVQDVKFKPSAKNQVERGPARESTIQDIAATTTNDANESVNLFRKANSIRVQGHDVPAPVKEFQELDVANERPLRQICSGLAALRIQDPTAVQSQVLPLLFKGRDVLAIAPTGSGKTLAFVLPILAGIAALKKAQKGPHALILGPTRELVQQTTRVMEDFKPFIAAKMACINLTRASSAGTDFSKVDVIVTTPLRLSRLARKKKLDLAMVQWLVLDEADKLLELKDNPHTVSHVHQVDKIMGLCTSTSLVTGIFSATIPQTVEALSKTFLKEPVRVTVGARNATADSILQQLQFAGSEEGKVLLLQQLLHEGIKAPVLIFVSSKEKAVLLQRKLVGYRVDSIFSNKDYRLRQQALDTFRSGETWLLISTDVLARGIDFVNIQTVINYDCPASIDDYVHRIGRTGRGGNSGKAVTFFTEDDGDIVRSIAHMAASMGQSVPQWMLSMSRKASDKETRKRRKH